MKKNTDRLNHFEMFRSPTPDEKGYKPFMDYMEKHLASNPKNQKNIKKKFEKALSIANTQAKNGIDLLQDKELRFFHAEFNDRTWNYGFGSLPSSFNVLEGFFKWDPKLFYFELLKEEEHMFSTFDFFDFVTSNNCSYSIDHFIETVEDDIIYSYNIINDIKEISFSTTDSNEYVFGGISFARRGNEVFMLIVAGEIGNNKEFSAKLIKDEPTGIGRSYIKPGLGRQKEAVKLFGREDIWKVNVYIRIDLETKTIDSRYIQKDEGIGFITFTDDYGMLEASIKDKETFEKMRLLQSEEISKYDAIFEAAYSFLYLPEYFDFYNSQLSPEEHPTGLYQEFLKKQFTTERAKFDLSYFTKTKDVWVLDRGVDPKRGINTFRKTELKIEKDGYWKLLEQGQLGIDKNGKKIHRRTWVEKTLAWHESVADEKQINVTVYDQKYPKKGYIYMLRNPSHMVNLFKIGLTTKTVEERADQLSGTSSPVHFLIICKWEVNDCVLAERLIHEKLDLFRLDPKREFFNLKIEDAIKEILPVIESVNAK